MLLMNKNLRERDILMPVQPVIQLPSYLDTTSTMSLSDFENVENT